jgi:transposase-like protein
MEARPPACPRCGAAPIIRSGHACGKQRWRCKACRLQFTRTTPRGKPPAMKREAIRLYCAGPSMNAIAKHFGVAAQSVLRWVRAHADRHCPRPEPEPGTACVVELDEVWHFVKKRPSSSGSGRRSPARTAG